MWKKISGYEGHYEVSSIGVVHSCERKAVDGKRLRRKKLNGGCYPNGYEYVCLRKDGKNQNRMIHRLVAEAFIPNPENLPCVNHIDGNKHNNDVSNLQWCTHSQNRKHAYDSGLSPQKGTPIPVSVHVNGSLFMEFETMRDAEKHFDFPKGWLTRKVKKYGNNPSFVTKTGSVVRFEVRK